MAIAKILSFKKFKLIWGQFGSEPDYRAYKKIRERIYLIQKKLEFMSDALIADGRRGIEFYKKLNFKLKKSTVILSGSDVDRFNRNLAKRTEFRNKQHLRDGDIAIGICSRLDPMKGYLVLAEAAKNILQKHSNVFFFSIGYGDDTIVTKCNEILGQYSDRFIWFGKKPDPENYMNGWDIYCSTSLYGEGFSNSIIEAMACFLPVVATDVGEANHQVGNTGKVLKPGDANELYLVLNDWICGKSFVELGLKARIRVVENFSSLIMARNTENFIKEVLKY
jgi:glycosyltransferase involved in cell wall biosynthesis